MLAIDGHKSTDRDEDARGRGKMFEARAPIERASRALAEGAIGRDTLVDPTCVPSRWARFRAFFDRFLDKLIEAIREPRLSDRLPPPPAPRSFGTGRSSGTFCGDERGELMLLEILRAPRAYQLGAIDVARYAVALGRLGDEAYAEGLVHFVLSRMHPDRDGAIPLTRLRDILCDMPFTRVLVPALLRLEASEIVHLVSTTSEGAPSEPGSGPRFARVELRIPL
jgi:hypothetical protein